MSSQPEKGRGCEHVLARAVVFEEPGELDLRDLEIAPPGPGEVLVDVEWTGTVRSGDFLAVAEVGSQARDSLDFSFASDGSPSNLAAPFKPGDYEVRYVSGSGLEVVAAVPLTVR